MKKSIWLAAALACFGVQEAAAGSCGCKIMSLYSDNSPDQLIFDLTAAVNANCPTNCVDLCKAAAQPYFNNPPAQLCAKGYTGATRNGVKIGVYAATCSTMQPWQVHSLTNNVPLTNTAPEYTKTCTCPGGWTCNGCNPQVAGGITSDGLCKKDAGTLSLTPPPNGTQIGSGSPSWGFTWGGSIYAWGTSANGGAPACRSRESVPAQCHFERAEREG